MIFVQNYATWEWVLVQCVRQLVLCVNATQVPVQSVRPQLLGLTFHPEFQSIIDGSTKQTWEKRSALMIRSRSLDFAVIAEGLFPKDGSQFRTSQLELIWELFGVPGPIVAESRHRFYINETVEKRNDIAHGTEPPDRVGERFTVDELGDRIAIMEAACTHVIVGCEQCVVQPSRFQ